MRREAAERAAKEAEAQAVVEASAPEEDAKPIGKADEGAEPAPVATVAKAKPRVAPRPA